MEYKVVLILVYGYYLLIANCNAGSENTSTGGETVDGDLLVKMGRQIKQPLLTLIGMAIRNLHQCGEWTTWTTCTSNGRPGNFGTRNRSRTCNKHTISESSVITHVEDDIRLCEGFCPKSYNLTENGSCLMLYDKPLNWEEAEKTCQLDGGHLFFMDTDLKFNDAKKMLKGFGGNGWIDGRRTNTSSPWYNVHGIELKKFYWHSGDPDNGSDELCLVLRNDETRVWHDIPCKSKYNPLCEITP